MKIISKYKYKIIPIGIILYISLVVLFTPSLSLAIGNIFFGKVPTLYNVTLANFFFKRATQSPAGSPPLYAHYQLSRTYFIQGDLDQALIEAKKELKLYPKNTRTNYILGLAYGYMNREREAIDSFSKFIDAYPETWAGRNDKAWLQFRIGDIDSALETLEPVVNNKSNPWIQNTYGTLLMNKNRYTEAKQAFDYALDATNRMTEKDWGKAYPGNDPRIYGTGLNAMRLSIQNNLKLLKNK